MLIEVIGGIGLYDFYLNGIETTDVINTGNTGVSGGVIYELRNLPTDNVSNILSVIIDSQDGDLECFFSTSTFINTPISLDIQLYTDETCDCLLYTSPSPRDA